MKMLRATTKSNLLNTVAVRRLSTKGHKKTRRIEAEKLEIQRSTRPQLPWYFQKSPPKRLTRFFADRDNLVAIKENADLIYKLLRAEPVRTPIGVAVNRLKARRLEIEREKWEARQLPIVTEKVKAMIEAMSPPPLPHVEEPVSVEPKMGLVESVETVDEAVPVVSTVSNTADHPAIQEAVEQSIKDDVRLQAPADPKEALLNDKVRELLAVEWIKELANRKNETSDALEKMFMRYTEQETIPPADLGLRLMYAYERERETAKSWETFLEFTGKRNIWSAALVEAGISVCGQRHKPERALSLFELGQIKFGRTHLPQFYHPTMRACAQDRGTTPYTFNLYDRMTTVDFLKPNTETLSILLKGCTVLGDVERAEMYWKEIVESGDVVPTEDCVIAMLNCYARGNRMLRAKTLKKDSIKILTFEDKARLALAGGFTPPKIDRTDEAAQLIRELDGLDPREASGRFATEQSDDWERDEDEAAAHEDDEDDENDPEVIAAKKEFETDEQEDMKNGEVQSDGHVMVIPGVSPASYPPITQASYQKTYDTLARLAAHDAANTGALIRTSKDEASNEVAIRDESTPGRRQEANISQAMTLVEAASKKHGVAITARVLNAELRVLAEALRLKRATDFLQVFEQHGVKPDLMTWNILINMFSRAQRVESAIKVFDSAKASGAVDKLTVGPLMDALARQGDVDRAFELYQQHKDVQFLERHLRLLRIKLKGDPRERDFPKDPNAWRSRENIARQMRAVGKDASARKTQNWLLSVARSV